MNVELLAVTPRPEHLIELAARTCYQSEARMTGKNAGTLLPKLLKMGHESPFEHAYATFRISGVSRAMTHQLVRHRLMAVSQKSQRYVSESAFDYVVPPDIAEKDREAYAADMEQIRQMYARWKTQGVRNEDARFVLPNACATEMVLSANFREFRHIFHMRCNRHAQWEIREVCSRMLRALYEHAPRVFADLMPLLESEKGDEA